MGIYTKSSEILYVKPIHKKFDKHLIYNHLMHPYRSN